LNSKAKLKQKPPRSCPAS